MSLDVGQPAPGFELKNGAAETVTLADFAGKPLALMFYPFTFSPVCEGEMCQMRDDFSVFEDAGVAVVAVSCDGRHSQRVWSAQEGFTFPVLSDFWPHGAAARAYGVFNEEVGCAMRATFFIDANGTIVDVVETDAIGTPREFDRYREALAKLG